MTVKKQCKRTGCKDVFNSFLVSHVKQFYDQEEIPPILDEGEIDLPANLIGFSQIQKSANYNQWVHFYEEDHKFEDLWQKPKQYLPILRRFLGVISPDYSVFRDMPLIQQKWQIYRGRAIGSWLQNNKIKVIANVRTADERTFDICCAGLAQNSIIATGALGCVKNITDRTYYIQGLEYVVRNLKPRTIIVYGSIGSHTKNIFLPYKEQGIEIAHIRCHISTRFAHFSKKRLSN